MQRFRPIGLSLAIVGSLLVFGFFPLIPALFVVLLALQGHHLSPEGLEFWAPAVMGILAIGVCAIAWRGRVRWGRIAFLVCTLLALAVNLYATFKPTELRFTSGMGGGSLDGLFRGLVLCLVPIRLLTALYCLWFVSRAPARAFYEGKKAPATHRSA